MEELIAAINDDTMQGKLDITPAGDALIERGPPVIPRVLDLMLSPGAATVDQHGVLNLTTDDVTRMRAQRVLAEITAREFRRPGEERGWQREDQDRFQAFWVSLGDLRWDAPLEQRRRSVEMWRAWFAGRQPG